MLRLSFNEDGLQIPTHSQMDHGLLICDLSQNSSCAYYKLSSMTIDF